MEKIFLIGFMGSGKSTVGRMLAEKLGWRFFDLDSFIEKEKAKTIRMIIEEEGETVFRQYEKAALEKVLCIEKAVIATGGGTPVFFDNMKKMNESGLTVYLCNTIETLEKRVLAGDRGKSRPLARFTEDREGMRKLLEDREAFYRKAGTVIEADRIGPDQVACRVAEAYKLWQKTH